MGQLLERDGGATMLKRATRRRFLGGAAAMLGGAALAGHPASAWARSRGTSLAAMGSPALEGDLLGRLTYHVTDGRHTLLEVAREHNLGVLEVSAVNPGVDAWVPGRERLIILPTAELLPEVPREGIVVNLSEMRLYHFPGEGGVPESHCIGIGRDGFGTPLGETEIVRKTADPTWYPTEATRADRPELPAVVPPGPDNPLGRHALYLGWPTYLIHGTNKPLGVGRRVSRGCLRMYPERVAALFERVPVGTPVRVIEEPIKLGWSGGELYLEAHPDLDQLDELEATYRFTLRPPPAIDDRLRAKAGDAAARIDWNVVEAELVGRRGIPVQITRRAEAVAETDASPSPLRFGSGFVGLY